MENKINSKGSYFLLLLQVINIREQIRNPKATRDGGIKQRRNLSTTYAPADNTAMLHDYSTMGWPTQAEYFFFRPLFLCLWHIFYTLCACK